jgi:hypothetical protein
MRLTGKGGRSLPPAILGYSGSGSKISSSDRIDYRVQCPLNTHKRFSRLFRRGQVELAVGASSRYDRTGVGWACAASLYSPVPGQ